MSEYNSNFTNVQVKGFFDIIKTLTNEDFLDLVNSVTKKTISISSKEEAFQAIIAFSASAEELLFRKKITRKILMQYAFDERIPVTSTVDKKGIIANILMHWKQKAWKNNENAENVNNQTTIVEPTPEGTAQTRDLATFGQTFASWFYPMWNSHNQFTNPSTPSEDFGPHHFWPDSSLLMRDPRESAEYGASKTAERLLQIVREGFYFQANLGSGVSTKTESHGLVGVIVHGTIHRGSYCCGPFEQAFTLLQDPSNGKWKIKNIWLQGQFTQHNSLSSS